MGSPAPYGPAAAGTAPFAQRTAMIASESNDRVVIYRLGSLGDTIVALPCFHAIARLYPRAERIVLTNFPVASVAAPLAAVLGSGGLASEYLAYPVGTRSVRELSALRSKLVSLRAHTLIYLASSRGLASAWRDIAFFKLCGFGKILGAPLSLDLQKNRIDPTTGWMEPECERLARTLAPAVHVDLGDPMSWDLGLDDEERRIGGAIIEQFGERPFFAIHCGGKGAAKDWGVENWRALLSALARSHGDHGLLLLGAREDASRYSALVSNWPGPVADSCGALTPRQSAAAMSNARLFIGHDSGPMHLASISGVPCVGLFGSMNVPRKWHPYFGTTRIIHRVDGILHIGVDEALDAALSMIESKSIGAPGFAPT